MLADLMTQALQVGLTVHLGRTCFITNAYVDDNLTKTSHLRVHGEQVDVVCGSESIKYLGRAVSASSFHETAVKHHERCGWAKFHEHRRELCDKRYPLKDRLCFFNPWSPPWVCMGVEPGQ